MAITQEKDISWKEARELAAGEGRTILAIAANRWGRGPTGAKAIDAMGLRRGAVVLMYEAPRGTGVNEMGNITYWPPEGKTWADVEDKMAYCSLTPLGETKKP